MPSNPDEEEKLVNRVKQLGKPCHVIKLAAWQKGKRAETIPAFC